MSSAVTVAPTARYVDTGARFGPVERSMSALMALMALIWASSSPLIAIAIDDVDPGVVPLVRVGTGLVFAFYGSLLARTGPVRGMIGTYFIPAVAVVLGALVRSEPLYPLALAAMSAVIVGAAMTSRPD